MEHTREVGHSSMQHLSGLLQSLKSRIRIWERERKKAMSIELKSIMVEIENLCNLVDRDAPSAIIWDKLKVLQGRK